MKRYAGFKLLIVDDHEHNLYTLRTLIQRHMDVVILEASSGRKALDVALAEPGIDLIILDVQMPEMDGFQTAQMLKIRKKTRDIPIIFLTAAFKSGSARSTACSRRRLPSAPPSSTPRSSTSRTSSPTWARRSSCSNPRGSSGR